MDNLYDLQAQLLALLNTHHSPPTQSITALQAQVAENDFYGLAWLKAQTDYPQCYLTLRDNSNTIIAIGEVRRFDTLATAQQFCSQQQLPLVGGLTFNRECEFILPRLLLQQRQGKLYTSLFIDNHADWHSEKTAVLACLKTLPFSTAVTPLSQRIRLLGQKADQTQWCQWVNNALHAIEQGTFSKVVLANETVFATDNPINAKDFLAESQDYHHDCYHFLWATKPNQAFVGSTPERLFARDHNQLYTEALAGTVLIGDDHSDNLNLCQQQGKWLLQDQKNIYENELVAKGICQNLAPFSQQIQVGEIYLRPQRKVQHLQRDIQVELNTNSQDQDCLNAIHPSAAVSGLPREAAMAFLKNNENFDRGWYAGTLGIMQPEQSEFCVTIRSAVIDTDKISVFAGAGIVAGSIPLLEWQEIERKAAGLVSLLQQIK